MTVKEKVAAIEDSWIDIDGQLEGYSIPKAYLLAKNMNELNNSVLCYGSISDIGIKKITDCAMDFVYIQNSLFTHLRNLKTHCYEMSAMQTKIRRLNEDLDAIDFKDVDDDYLKGVIAKLQKKMSDAQHNLATAFHNLEKLRCDHETQVQETSIAISKVIRKSLAESNVDSLEYELEQQMGMFEDVAEAGEDVTLDDFNQLSSLFEAYCDHLDDYIAAQDAIDSLRNFCPLIPPLGDSKKSTVLVTGYKIRLDMIKRSVFTKIVEQINREMNVLDATCFNWVKYRDEKIFFRHWSAGKLNSNWEDPAQHAIQKILSIREQAILIHRVNVCDFSYEDMIIGPTLVINEAGCSHFVSDGIKQGEFEGDLRYFAESPVLQLSHLKDLVDNRHIDEETGALDDAQYLILNAKGIEALRARIYEQFLAAIRLNCTNLLVKSFGCASCRLHPVQVHAIHADAASILGGYCLKDVFITSAIAPLKSTAKPETKV